MNPSAVCRSVALALLAVILVAVGELDTLAQGPVYQRSRASAADRARVMNAPRYRPGPTHRGRETANRGAPQTAPHRPPNASGGHFTRPYPYHLDYYKQRFGGSYAPYFGNLYGPPNVVLAPGYGGYVQSNPAPFAEPITQPNYCPHCGQPWPHIVPQAAP